MALRRGGTDVRLGLAITLLVLTAFAGSSCRNEGGVAVPPPAELQAAMVEDVILPSRAVRLWFEAESRRLAPETREIPLPESDSAALKPLIKALLEKNGEEDDKPVPDGIEVRAGYLLPEGTAIIDLGGPLFVGGWKTGSAAEVMLVYSVVQTATDNLPSVRQVQILLNGHPADTLAGHVSIEHPLRPIPSLLAR